jgi:hypothetical protein
MRPLHSTGKFGSVVAGYTAAPAFAGIDLDPIRLEKQAVPARPMRV